MSDAALTASELARLAPLINAMEAHRIDHEYRVGAPPLVVDDCIVSDVSMLHAQIQYARRMAQAALTNEPARTHWWSTIWRWR